MATRDFTRTMMRVGDIADFTLDLRGFGLEHAGTTTRIRAEITSISKHRLGIRAVDDGTRRLTITPELYVRADLISAGRTA